MGEKDTATSDSRIDIVKQNLPSFFTNLQSALKSNQTATVRVFSFAETCGHITTLQLPSSNVAIPDLNMGSATDLNPIIDAISGTLSQTTNYVATDAFSPTAPRLVVAFTDGQHNTNGDLRMDSLNEIVRDGYFAYPILCYVGNMLGGTVGGLHTLSQIATQLNGSFVDAKDFSTFFPKLDQIIDQHLVPKSQLIALLNGLALPTVTWFENQDGLATLPRTMQSGSQIKYNGITYNIKR